MSAPGWVLMADGARCKGHGICALVVPGRVHLDHFGYAVVSGAPLRDDAELARARRAVRACPAGALRLTARPSDARGTQRP